MLTALGQIAWRLATEPLAILFECASLPVFFGRSQVAFGNSGIDPALLQLDPYPLRAEPLVAARSDELFGKTLIAKQIVGGKSPYHLVDQALIIFTKQQLTPQLLGRMLAPRQKSQRRVTYLCQLLSLHCLGFRPPAASNPEPATITANSHVDHMHQWRFHRLNAFIYELKTLRSLSRRRLPHTQLKQGSEPGQGSVRGS